MKRFVTIFAALAVAMAALPARAEAPGASAGVEQFAEADWVIMRNRSEGAIYFALAWRTLTDTGPITIGAVGKGKCRIYRTKHMKIMSCHGSGRGKPLGVDEFMLHPLLEDASMTMKSDGYTHTVDWTGRGALPTSAGAVQGGDNYVLVGAEMARDARADAQLFGRRMPKLRGWLASAYLAQGGIAFVRTEGRSLEVSPDGTFTYEVTVRRPR